VIEQHGSRMNTLEPAGYASRLRRLIAADPQCMRILRQLAALEPQAYLAAGVIRNSVWAHLHGQRYALEQTEIDVIFYDVEHRFSRCVQFAMPSLYGLKLQPLWLCAWMRREICRYWPLWAWRTCSSCA